MSQLSAQEEITLRGQDLDHQKAVAGEELKIRREELGISRRNSWVNLIANPLFIALIGAASAAATYWFTRLDAAEARQQEDRREAVRVEHNARELCYRVLSDHLNRNPSASPRDAALDLATAARAINRREDCAEVLREQGDRLTSRSVVAAVPAPTASSPATAASSSASAVVQVCEKVTSLRTLGWTSGHKTRFCEGRKYDGVYNPFGNYSAGGFCYTGSSDECIRQILAGRTN